MRRLISLLTRNRYCLLDLLAIVCGGIGAGLGAGTFITAWDWLHMQRWLPKSWTLAERENFRVFWVGSAGAIMGIFVAGVLLSFLIIRQSKERTPKDWRWTHNLSPMLKSTQIRSSICSWLLPTGQAAQQESLQFVQLVRVDQVYFRGA